MGGRDARVEAGRPGRQAYHDMGDRVDPGEPARRARDGRRRPGGHAGGAAAPGRAGEARAEGDARRPSSTSRRSRRWSRPAWRWSGPGRTWPASGRSIQRGAGTSQDFQNAENDEKAAAAGLENAILTARAILANAQASQVALDVARQARLDMEIRAPVPSATPPGVTGPIKYAITRRSVAEGQMLKQGDPVVDLVIENPLRLWTNVPERYSAAGRARPAGPHHRRVAPGRDLRGDGRADQPVGRPGEPDVPGRGRGPQRRAACSGPAGSPRRRS